MTSGPDDRLFTPQFFMICGFSFTTFMSVFQLLPTAPFHILALGGSGVEAGLFLGFLTYASAFSGPFTGAVGDRFGKRRILLVVSLAITGFSVAYALAPSYHWLLGLVLFHGVFWSGLLSSSSAYVTDIVPAARRAEGLGYAGFASIMAIAVAPTVGLWVFEQGGWRLVCAESVALNLLMAWLAWQLPSDRPRTFDHPLSLHPARVVEWRVLVGAFTLFMYSFGYGGITSFVAVYAERVGVTPKALYFVVFSSVILLTRPFVSRYADRVGHARVLVPCLASIVAGLALLSMAGSRAGFVVSAVLFGVGFGSAWPVFIAHLMHHVPDSRRGAAFGAVIGAFDTGIGTGSITVGWIGGQFGFGRAYAMAAALAALSIPYFLYLEKRQWTTSVSARPA